MKQIFIAFAFCLCSIASCTKVKYLDSGVITGPNMLMCATKCCSGFYIEINNTTYLFEQLPTNADIDLKSPTYPIPVELNWRPTTGCSSPQTIEITEIKKR